MAAFSVGQSAVGSVADTISTFAPLAIAAWIAGIWDVGVAAVPLVSVPVSPSADSAASAPPDFTLSAVVKYGLPRFLGMTNTFKPVLRPPLPPPPEGEEGDVDGEDDDELADEHAASMPVITLAANRNALTLRRRELPTFGLVITNPPLWSLQADAELRISDYIAFVRRQGP